MQYLGETFLFPVVDGKSIASTSTEFQFFYPCDGATLSVNASGGDSCGGPVPAGPSNLTLATRLGADTSGSDPTFVLPKLPSPADGVAWFISNTGPVAIDRAIEDAMPLIGQISVFPNMATQQQYSQNELIPCDGRVLPAEQFPALFSLLGTTYGSPQEGYFALPNVPPPAPSLFYGMGTIGQAPPLVPFDQEVPG